MLKVQMPYFYTSIRIILHTDENHSSVTDTKQYLHNNTFNDVTGQQ